MEKHKGEGDLGSLVGQLVGVAFAIALDQTMRLHFAEIITELIQAVAGSGELEGGRDGIVDLLGSPPTDGRATMQQDLHVTALLARPWKVRVPGIGNHKLAGEADDVCEEVRECSRRAVLPPHLQTCGIARRALSKLPAAPFGAIFGLVRLGNLASHKSIRDCTRRVWSLPCTTLSSLLFVLSTTTGLFMDTGFLVTMRQSRIIDADEAVNRFLALSRWFAMLAVVGVAASLATEARWRGVRWLDLFWQGIVPLVPLTLLVAPHVWRKICPMAVLNLAAARIRCEGREIGEPRLPRKTNVWIKRYGVMLAACLFWLLVPMRLLLFNQSAYATLALILANAVAAVTLGIVGPWKAAWCSSVCPMYPVEKL